MLNARTRKTGLASYIGSAAIGLIMAAFPFPSLAQNWPTKEWDPACSAYGSGVCDLDDVGVEVFLLQLEESSARFEAMGFPAPALDTLGTSPDAYPIYFFEEDLTLPPGKSFVGFYDIQNRRIDVDYTEYFAMNTQTHGNMYAPRTNCSMQYSSLIQRCSASVRSETGFWKARQ